MSVTLPVHWTLSIHHNEFLDKGYSNITEALSDLFIRKEDFINDIDILPCILKNECWTIRWKITPDGDEYVLHARTYTQILDHFDTGLSG